MVVAFAVSGGVLTPARRGDNLGAGALELRVRLPSATMNRTTAGSARRAGPATSGARDDRRLPHCASRATPAPAMGRMTPSTPMSGRSHSGHCRQRQHDVAATVLTSMPVPAIATAFLYGFVAV